MKDKKKKCGRSEEIRGDTIKREERTARERGSNKTKGKEKKI